MKSEQVFRMYGSLVEQIGDNKVDNMVGDLARSTEIEIQMFVASLLNSNIKTFLRFYVVPQFEAFKTAVSDIQERYKVMDELERTDLLHKIESMWKDIFIRNFGILGPDAAEMMATRYAAQMIREIKIGLEDPLSTQEKLYPKAKELYPDGSPETQPLSRPEAIDKVLSQLVEPEKESAAIPDFRNVY
jgi:hypothetical protein